MGLGVGQQVQPMAAYGPSPAPQFQAQARPPASFQAQLVQYHIKSVPFDPREMMFVPHSSVHELCSALEYMPAQKMIQIDQQIGTNLYPGTPMTVSQYREFFHCLRDVQDGRRAIRPLRRRYTKKQSKY